MKIMSILGSPRKKGNTAKVLALFEELMVQQRHEIDRMDIVDYEVKGCLGCDMCQKKPNEPGCVQKDDAVALFDRMMVSDLVIYATPLYCWGFSAQLKALLDRQYCLVTGYDSPDYKSLIAGKRTVLLVTCADQIENNADLIQEVFERENAYCNCRVIGKYVVPFCTTPDKLGDKAIETAKKMAGECTESHDF